MTTTIRSDASGTFGALTFGGDDVLRFGSDNSGQLAGFRNKLINGGCQVAQRGSIPVSSDVVTYGGADRIFVASNGWSAVSGTLVSANGVSTASGSAQRLFIASSTGTANVIFGQRIEAANSAPLKSKTITVSCRVFQSSGSAKNALIQLNKPNAANNFLTTTSVATSGSTSVPSGVWTPVTFTYILSATDATNGLEVECVLEGLGALSNVDFYFGDFQLEEGSIATPFETRPIGLELILCQRYYQKVRVSVNGYTPSGVGSFGCSVNFQSMRSIPTVSAPVIDVNTNCTSQTFDKTTTNSARVYVNNVAAGTVSWVADYTLTAEL